MLLKILAATVLSTNVLVTSGKVFGLCELANALHYEHSVPLEQLAMWLCIAYYESKYNTSAINPNVEDFGIFQISRLYWCNPKDVTQLHSQKPLDIQNYIPNECNTGCSSFLDDDITDDVECAKKIYKDHEQFDGDGYTAWAVYPRHCQRQWPLIPEWCFQDGVIPRHLSSKAFD